MRQFFTIAVSSLVLFTASQAHAQFRQNGNTVINKVGNGIGNRINVGSGQGNALINNVGNGIGNKVVINNGRGTPTPTGGKGLFNNIGNGIGNTVNINIGSNNVINSNNGSNVRRFAPSPVIGSPVIRPIVFAPSVQSTVFAPVAQPVVVASAAQPVFVAATETTTTGAVARIAVKQTERFLRVKNDSGEKLTVFVQFRTTTGQGTKQFFPKDPGSDEAVAFTFEAGQEATLRQGDATIGADIARIWAETASGAQIDTFRTKDLVLVPEPYEAAERESFLFTFSR